MTEKQLQKRLEGAQDLRVLQVGEGFFLVESTQRKIFYKVAVNGDATCTCADFTKNGKGSDFQCKHILAAQNCNGGAEKASFLERRKPKLDERFIINIKGKDFVKYSGLLDLAHQKGLQSIDVEVVQYPSKENGQTAICRAIAESRFDEHYIDVGDANPSNTTKEIAAHILRMASTRAKARVLRDLTNIGMTCLEELGDLSEVIENHSPNSAQNKPKQPKKPDKKASAKNLPKSKSEQPERATGGPAIFVAQQKAIENLAARRGITADELSALLKDQYEVSSIQDLNSSQASSFITYLQKSA